MTFSQAQTEALNAKLEAASVKTRSQSGRTLSYIEGWHAIAEANRIFGFSEWDRETVDLKQLGGVYANDKGNQCVNYMARVRITVRAGETTICREGCGFGSGIDRDEGRAHESALKEAETDAMKRALMTFGNPFGLALYDKTQEGVEKPEPKHTPKPVAAPEPIRSPEPRTKAEAAMDWVVMVKPTVKALASAEAVGKWAKENHAMIERLKTYPAAFDAMVEFLNEQTGAKPSVYQAA